MLEPGKKAALGLLAVGWGFPPPFPVHCSSNSKNRTSLCPGHGFRSGWLPARGPHPEQRRPAGCGSRAPSCRGRGALPPAQARGHLAESLVPLDVETDDVTNTPPTDP